MDVTERQALTTFEELARLYGEERALNMVRIQPLVLAIRSCQNFEPALDTWSQTFGAEAAQAMVARNPGLLFIQPELAERDAFGAMAWSYILWATRPVLSKLVLIGFLIYQYASVATSEDGLPSWLVHASDGL